jgi:cyclophilin family peptidyl-prolyl cis-trans isomerase
MKASLWMLLALIAAVLMLAACPRNNGGDTATTPPGLAGSQQTTANGAAGDGIQQPLDAGNPVDTTTGTPTAANSLSSSMTMSNNPRVVFETTKGNITMEIHKEWAPLGAEHFLQLVNEGFYNGAPWFRVIDGFMAQCGIAADPAMNEKWAEATIQDEPVVKGNLRGFVAFGKSSLPNSRSSHIFINMVDNSSMLDGQGFACFAEVVEGMEVVDKLARVEYQDQGGLAAPGGLEKFKTQFPNADYITKAYVVEAAKTPAAEAPATPETPGAPGASTPPAAPEGKGGM